MQPALPPGARKAGWREDAVFELVIVSFHFATWARLKLRMTVPSNLDLAPVVEYTPSRCLRCSVEDKQLMFVMYKCTMYGVLIVAQGTPVVYINKVQNLF